MGVLEQSYNTAMDKPLRILNIFNEFFGESRVDMQGFPTLADVESVLSENTSAADIQTYIINNPTSRGIGFILVHWPHVRVTNEFDRYTDMNHLYAKVDIGINGKIQGRFSLNRSEYSTLHFVNGYMHSHVSQIPTYNFQEFQIPCTGSGPINNTICSLVRDFDEDLWRLFCLELDRYVQVESIAGTPYHRLESLTASGNRGYSYPVCTTVRAHGALNRSELGGIRGDCITFPQLAEFIKYVIDSGILKFSYQEGGYYLALSPTEYYIKVSNLFIKWYNKKYKRGEVTATLGDLTGRYVLNKCKFVNGQLIKESHTRLDPRPYIGSLVCYFKGEPVRLTISDPGVEEESANDVYILNQGIAEYIFTKIFNVVNFRYGNNKEQGTEPCKKVYFI